MPAAKKALTTLTPQSLQGKSKTTVLREIFSQIGTDIPVKNIGDELKRLVGSSVVDSLIYSERRKFRNLEDREMTAAQIVDDTWRLAQETKKNGENGHVADHALEAIKTYKRVQALANELGGVEKLRKFLEVVE